MKHEALILRIEDIAFGGRGVARHDGKAVFVPLAIDGETVTARLVREKKNFAEAELISVVEPSPERVESPCPYYSLCGGCSYLHVRYEHQLVIKQRQVEQTLRRVGRLENVPMQPAVASPQPLGYRNRIRVHADGGVAGFYARDQRTIVDVENCAIAAPKVNAALQKWRQTALPRRFRGDFTATARPAEFFEQTNDAVAKLLADAVAAAVAPETTLLVDAYCGAGFFAKHLASRVARVIGLEENERAIATAKKSAAPNEQYIAGDVAWRLEPVLRENDLATTTLLLDPPAAGLDPRVVEIILASQPAEIIYVSCDPATLARDLAKLSSAYTMQTVTPFDMFPQTAEVEVLVHLRKK